MKTYQLFVCNKCNEPIEDNRLILIEHPTDNLSYHMDCSPVRILSTENGRPFKPFIPKEEPHEEPKP